MQFEFYLIKIEGGDAFYSYYILYHYFKISKIRQKFKNSVIVKNSKSQVSDIILDGCMQLEKFPIKTVEEAFYSYDILYNFYSMIVEKSTSQVSDIIIDACIKFESYSTKTVGGDRF